MTDGFHLFFVFSFKHSSKLILGGVEGSNNIKNVQSIQVWYNVGMCHVCSLKHFSDLNTISIGYVAMQTVH